VTDLDELVVAQGLGGDEPGTRLPPDLPPPPTIDDTQYLQQRCARGFPAIGEKEGYLPHTSDDVGHQRGSRLLGARACVNPEKQPTAHRERRMHPDSLAGAECGMGCIQLHAWYVCLAHDLAMVGLSSLGRALLQAVQGSLAFRECLAACRTAQPFDVFVRSCPRPMGSVAFAKTIESCIR